MSAFHHHKCDVSYALRSPLAGWAYPTLWPIWGFGYPDFNGNFDPPSLGRSGHPRGLQCRATRPASRSPVRHLVRWHRGANQRTFDFVVTDNPGLATRRRDGRTPGGPQSTGTTVRPPGGGRRRWLAVTFATLSAGIPPPPRASCLVLRTGRTLRACVGRAFAPLPPRPRPPSLTRRFRNPNDPRASQARCWAV